MELTYQVTHITKESRTVEILNENYISVAHRELGRKFITAFIGKGEGNNEKTVITVSENFDYLQYAKMQGDAEFNAKLLLQKDSVNRIINNNEFESVLNETKKRFNLCQQ